MLKKTVDTFLPNAVYIEAKLEFSDVLLSCSTPKQILKGLCLLLWF